MIHRVLSTWHKNGCLQCGNLVSPQQEAKGKGMLYILRGAGPYTSLYCQSCLHNILLEKRKRFYGQLEQSIAKCPSCRRACGKRRRSKIYMLCEAVLP
jgi:NAD-dependent SIR2 family protein deacetylase